MQASWIDQYVDVVSGFVASQAVLAPLLLLFIEEMGIPLFIPGDAILAYVGYKIGGGNPESFWLAFTVAMISVLFGATILFRLSQRYGQRLILKLGKFLFIKRHHIAKSEKLFAKYGTLAIIFGRHIPGLRIPITIIAGSSGLSYTKFIISTFLSTFLWVPFYIEAGRHYGGNIAHMLRHGTLATVIVAMVIIVVVLTFHLRGMQQKPDESK
jgi:membrane protein DedA with SNARE-associated domain